MAGNRAGQLTSGCRTCLLDYTNQRLWDTLDRAAGVVWLEALVPAARDLFLDQLYRALDILAEHGDAIEEGVHSVDLFKLDVDLVFYGATTAWFECDEKDSVPSRSSRSAEPPAAALSGRHTPSRHPSDDALISRPESSRFPTDRKLGPGQPGRGQGVRERSRDFAPA